MSEHRLYLASVGMLIALAVILRLGRPNARVLVMLFAGILLLGVMSVQRNRLWQTELTLWRDLVDKAPMMFRAQSKLVRALHEAGEYEAARRGFELAIELNPR